jgi:hypothetical protein
MPTTRYRASTVGDDDDDDESGARMMMSKKMQKMLNARTRLTTTTKTTTKTDFVRENKRAIRDASARTRAMRREGGCARGDASRTGSAARGRGEAALTATPSNRTTARTKKDTTNPKINIVASPRVFEDLERARALGAQRVREVEKRVEARRVAGNSARRDGYGTTPKYLLERKATLLREMNEKMETTLREIERRRAVRSIEVAKAREAREARDREREERLRRRAAIDAEKITPRQRGEAKREMERARELFARARLTVDQRLY